jgi:hypothetical protein
MFASYAQCVTEHGCAVEYGELLCCLEARCPTRDRSCDDAAMAEGGSCAAVASAVESCALTAHEGPCAAWGQECWADVPPRLCYGTATTTGEYHGEPVPVRYAYAYEGGGEITMIVSNHVLERIAVGERALLLALLPIEGQLTYTPVSGQARCGIIVRTETGWAPVVGESCEMILTQLRFASAPGVCDGRITGVFRTLFGLEPFGGAFDAPLPVAASQIVDRCRPTDAPCSENDQCCSRSCAPWLGRCY